VAGHEADSRIAFGLLQYRWQRVQPLARLVENLRWVQRSQQGFARGTVGDAVVIRIGEYEIVLAVVVKIPDGCVVHAGSPLPFQRRRFALVPNHRAGFAAQHRAAHEGCTRPEVQVGTTVPSKATSPQVRCTRSGG